MNAGKKENKWINAVGHGGEKSLDHFDEKVPPGWAPNVPGYPWILYTKKLEMWVMRYRLAALPEEKKCLNRTVNRNASSVHFP